MENIIVERLNVANVFHDVTRVADSHKSVANDGLATKATMTLPLEQVRVMQASIDHLNKQVADLASRLHRAELRAIQNEARERLAKEDLIVTRGALAAAQSRITGLERDLDQAVGELQRAGL